MDGRSFRRISIYLRSGKGLHVALIVVALLAVAGFAAAGDPPVHKDRRGVVVDPAKPSVRAIPAPVIVGHSVEGRPIEVYTLGRGKEVVLVMGGFHGDEPAGVHIVKALMGHLHRNPGPLAGKTVVLVPEINPDGVARRTRGNFNKVDINRNFPTTDWGNTNRRSRYNAGKSAASEPETQAVISLLKDLKPSRIISMHAPLRQVNYDGPAKEIAMEMSRNNKYPVTANIGYPTPGSFGTYAGKERKIPTITLELSSAAKERAWEENRDALIAAITYTAKTSFEKKPDGKTQKGGSVHCPRSARILASYYEGLKHGKI